MLMPQPVLKRRTYYFVLAVVAVVLVDYVGIWPYYVRTAFKVTVFGIVPWLLVRELPKYTKGPHFKRALQLSVVVLVGLLGLFLVLRHLGYFTFSASGLEAELKISKQNLILIFPYIVFINGPLEEFYFRFILNKYLPFKKQYVRIWSSALLFSLYHSGMLIHIFEWYLLLLAFVGLVVTGVVFSWLNNKASHLLESTLVHMSANVAINIAGFILLS